MKLVVALTNNCFCSISLQFVHDDVRNQNGHFASQGQRIATGIHALQTHVDTHVGWIDMGSEDSKEEGAGSYIVRPRSPYKANVDVDALTTPIRFHSFAMHLAVVNAINHARADNDYNPQYIPWSFEEELVAIVGTEIDNFAAVLVEYAFMNADRVTEDYQCFTNSKFLKQVFHDQDKRDGKGKHH